MQFFKHKKNLILTYSHYFILAGGLTLGFISYFLTYNQPALQAGTVICTGLFYIIWGTMHHASQDDFHLKIILEYTLISSLAMSLLLTLIFRS